MQIIDPLTLSEGNYKIVWQVLEKNSQTSVQDKINTLLAVQFADEKDANSLGQVTNTIEMHRNALSMLGEETSTWDPIIIGLLTSKLDIKTLE